MTYLFRGFYLVSPTTDHVKATLLGKECDIKNGWKCIVTIMVKLKIIL